MPANRATPRWSTGHMGTDPISSKPSSTPASHSAASGESILIDCGTCVVRESDACTDCVVTFLCREEPEMAVVFDLEELRAVRVLAEAGLVPTLRHRAPGQANAS